MAKSGSSKGIVPEAREALDRFKMEAASEVGVTNHLKAPRMTVYRAFRGSPKSA